MNVNLITSQNENHFAFAVMRLKEDVETDKSQSWVHFNGVILKQRIFPHIILSELLPWISSKMSRQYLKNVNGDKQYRQIFACR